MPRRRILPVGAIPRVCAMCHRHFHPMTEREWAHNRRQHELLSLKHNPAAYAAPRKSEG
jgi:hypothetical protein